jgi:hypothetical protein
MRSFILYFLLLLSYCTFANESDTIIAKNNKRTVATEKPESIARREPSYFEKYVKPKSIDALISYCETQWMQEEKDSFAAMPEKVAVVHNHYWYASWISGMRIYLLDDSTLSAEFVRYGVTDLDDRWRIILTSLHRRLNHQDINLATQVKQVRRKRVKK